MLSDINNHKTLEYVLITPARNEEKYIEKTIISVLSQTVLPKKWIIVSDGSTDRTDDIVAKYLINNPWMQLLRMKEHKDRQFAAKVYCFNAGYDQLKGAEYDIIGNLDADISFGNDYFEFLLEKFSENNQLGVAGTAFIEDSMGPYNYNYTNIEHVSGQCQLFRRKCFEEIGGYLPIKGGGIDWAAVTTARMIGWKTRTFPEKIFFHHRPLGTASDSKIKSYFNYGKKDYSFGGHPVWELLRSFYQMKSKPYIIGGISLLIGYAYAYCKRIEKPFPEELILFNRKEQMSRLKKIMLNLVNINK